MYSHHKDIILSTFISTGKLVFFLITPSRSTIDAYCTTTIHFHEVHDTLTNLLKLLSQAFDRFFSINLRLQLSVDFHADPLFLALFLIAIIQQHGKYYRVTDSLILDFKLWMVREVITVHDTFLGQLEVQKITRFSHPFQTPRRPEDEFDKLEKMGWHVIDVAGDGNCGYYCFFLGLQNVGMDAYFVDSEPVSQRVGIP